MCHLGTPCVAKYSEDETYYRAEVVSVHPSPTPGKPPLCGVLFVDYGSAEYIYPDK